MKVSPISSLQFWASMTRNLSLPKNSARQQRLGFHSNTTESPFDKSRHLLRDKIFQQGL